jgi:hypothetical protein
VGSGWYEYVRYWLPALACGGAGISGMPGIPGIGALMFIFIEQQLAGCEQQPPLQANASLAQQTRPQQPRTDVATNFNMLVTPR